MVHGVIKKAITISDIETSMSNQIRKSTQFLAQSRQLEFKVGPA